jgi:hypothetical protein
MSIKRSHEHIRATQYDQFIDEFVTEHERLPSQKEQISLLEECNKHLTENEIATICSTTLQCRLYK